MALERVLIEQAARAAICGHTRSSIGVETGGILLGRRLGESTLQITRASPPGPQARHGRIFFSRDTRFLQRYLDSIHDRTDGEEDYVGEWHVHPSLDAPPSRTDRRSLWRIARRRNYATDNPVLLIAEHDSPQMQFRVYGFVVRPRQEVTELVLVSSRKLRRRSTATGSTGGISS
ncbi:MAG: Mov34/MPN/PAD-1 family protein [Solirubrobacterales bacterium]